MRFPFKEFANHSEYKRLKNILANKDYKDRYYPPEDIELTLTAPILIAQIDYEGNFQNGKDVFLKELLVDFIEEDTERVKRSFLKDIQTSKNYTKENISHLANTVIAILTDLNQKIQSADFLEPEIIEPLKEGKRKLHEFFNEYVEDPYPQIKKKLDFNLNRSEVTYLFHILRENNILSKNTTDVQLAVILQRMLRYKNSSDEYKDMISIKGWISDFNNPNGEKSKVIPAAALEKIFQKENFFLP